MPVQLPTESDLDPTIPPLTDAPVSSVALTTALTQIWQRAQVLNPGLPDVMLLLSNGSSNGRLSYYGSFEPGRWTGAAGTLPELVIAGEGLRRGALPVLGTVLHEAAHALAFARNVGETSRNGTYHNGKFKSLAEEVGLLVGRDEHTGWSVTRPDPQLQVHYASEIAQLNPLLQVKRVVPHCTVIQATRSTVPMRRRPPRPQLKCQCDPPRWITLGSAAALDGICCAVCCYEFK